MDREHIVQEVRVEIGGETLTGFYFIEDGVIHASIGNDDYRLPLDGATANETVRAHLMQLRNRDFKTEISGKWFGK